MSTQFPGILLWVGGVLELLEASVIQKRCGGRALLCFSPGCCHKRRFYSISWCWVDRLLSTKQGVYSPGQALWEALWTLIVVWLGRTLSAAWIFLDLLPRQPQLVPVLLWKITHAWSVFPGLFHGMEIPKRSQDCYLVGCPYGSEFFLVFLYFWGQVRQSKSLPTLLMAVHIHF